MVPADNAAECSVKHKVQQSLFRNKLKTKVYKEQNRNKAQEQNNQLDRYDRFTQQFYLSLRP